MKPWLTITTRQWEIVQQERFGPAELKFHDSLVPQHFGSLTSALWEARRQVR